MFCQHFRRNFKNDCNETLLEKILSKLTPFSKSKAVESLLCRDQRERADEKLLEGNSLSTIENFKL